jgi:hypothetical protein
VLGGGSGREKGCGLVPIHVGSRHLISVLEAEARKLERAPLSRQVIVATSSNSLGRVKIDTHASSLRPALSPPCPTPDEPGPGDDHKRARADTTADANRGDSHGGRGSSPACPYVEHR